jgi:DNA end-binding protein Ku
MFYADEVVPVDEIEQMAEDVDQVTASSRSRPKAGGREEREVAMAQQLVDSLSGHFDPSQYHDEYRSCVMQLIEKKAAGEKVVFHKSRGPKVTKPTDLTSVLKASLEHVKKTRKRGSENGHT